jgi:hypothetical protein
VHEDKYRGVRRPEIHRGLLPALARS